MTITDILSGVYDFLGRPTQEKLSLGLVLPHLLDAINFYSVDLDLTDNGWMLSKFDYIPSAKDEVFSAPNFSDQVSVEVRDVNSTSETDWMPIDIANVDDIQRINRDGGKACAFYGTAPTNIIFSFDPQQDWQIEARVWYKPNIPVPSQLSDSPKLAQAFHTMLKIRTALSCLPYAKLDGGEGIATNLIAQLQGWEKKWDMWVRRDRNAGPIQKRDFRGARRSSGWNETNSKYWW